MSKRRPLVLGTLTALGVLASAGLVFVNGWVAPTGTGYYAKIMCSGLFVDGLARERVETEELRPYWYISANVDEEAKRVTARLMGMAPRTAVYREGLGCSLAIDISPDELQARAPQIDRRPALADQDWPIGERVTEAPIAGVDYAALAAALDYGFAEPDPEHLRLTRAIVVLYGDQLVSERYAEGIDATTRLPGWSMTKSVNAALVGILVGQAALDLHAPAPVPAWQGAGDPRAAITLDQMMRMSSGLDFEEVYGPLSDATTMLFESSSAAEFAMASALAAPPDTVWSYSSGTSNVLGWIVRQTVAGQAGVDHGGVDHGGVDHGGVDHGGVDEAWERYVDFPRAALFDPLGMRSALLEPDASGTFVASSFMHANARDWARFGLLHLRDGVWGDQRILPAGWVDYVSTPTPGAPIGEYGAQWWTNGGRADDPSDRRFPSGPRDLYQASGFQGQAVIVVPSRDVVIVRLGMTHSRDALDLDGLIAQVLAAMPAAPTAN